MPRGRFGQAVLTGALLGAAVYSGGLTVTAGGFVWGGKALFAKALAAGVFAAAATYAFFRKPEQPASARASTVGIKLSAGIRPRFRRYGHGLVDGHCVWLETYDEQHRITGTRQERVPGTGMGDSDPEYRTVTYTIAEANTTCFAYIFNVSYGQCDAITGIWVQGRKVPLTRDTTVTNKLVASDGSRYVRKVIQNQTAPVVEVHEFFDANGGAASSTIMSEINRAVTAKNATGSTTWGNTDLCTGYSQVLVIIRQPKYGDTRADQTPDDDKRTGRFWQSFVAPEQILFELRGNKLTWPGQTTPVWTENVAVIYRDMIINEANEPASRINQTAFEAARRACDEIITLRDQDGWVAGMPATLRRYAAFLDYQSGEGIRGAFDELDKAWSGHVVDADGLLYFKPGTERMARVTIDEGAIVEGGQPEIKPAPHQNERLNIAQMSLKQNALDDFKAYVVPDVRDEPAIARDGREYPYNFGELRCVTNSTRAAILGTTALREGRNAKSMTVTVWAGENWEYWSLIPTDAVTVNLPREGIANEKWEVVSRNRDSRNFTVTLILKRWAPNRYSYNLVLPELPTVVSAEEDVVPVPSGLSASIGVLTQPGSPTPQWAMGVSWNPASALTVVYIEKPGGSEAQRSGIISGNYCSFESLTPGTYNVIANHIGNDGEISARSAITVSIDPSVFANEFQVEAPVFVRETQTNNTLQIHFAPPMNVGISGIDIRYVRGPINDHRGSHNLLDEDNWLTFGTGLVTTAAVPTPGIPTVVTAIIPQAGSYRLFARNRSSLGGLSSIVEIGLIVFTSPLLGTIGLNLYPGFEGEFTNLYLWEHAEENVLVPNYGPANATTIDQWNGVADWPFGDAPAGSYVMPPIDFGGEKRRATVRINPSWLADGIEALTPLPANYTPPTFVLEERENLTDAWTSGAQTPFPHEKTGPSDARVNTGEYEEVVTTKAVSQVRVRLLNLNATGDNLGLRRFDISIGINA